MRKTNQSGGINDCNVGVGTAIDTSSENRECNENRVCDLFEERGVTITCRTSTGLTGWFDRFFRWHERWYSGGWLVCRFGGWRFQCGDSIIRPAH